MGSREEIAFREEIAEQDFGVRKCVTEEGGGGCKDGTSRQDSEFVWLEGEARVAIRMEHQGKQDSEVFSWNKEQGMTIRMEC